MSHKRTDPRNMNRSTLLRHLRSDVHSRESKTLRRKIFDEETEGWRLEWTDNPHSETRVVWVNGNTVSDRGRNEKQREMLRVVTIDEVEQALLRRGYIIKKETGCVLVLRRIT